MLKLSRASNSLAPVETPKLAQAGIKEREDLQRLIANSPVAFFGELGEELLLLGEEVPAWGEGGERMDLVALARDGALVVIELKRGNDPRQLLQGIAYAAVTAKWPATKPAEVLALFAKITTELAQGQITDYLHPDAGGVNTRQRVLLVAEAFDPIVLATAEWLVERYGVELRCHRLALYKDGANEYLTAARVYPPEEALPPAISATPSPTYTTWDEALESIQNEDVRAFFLANEQNTVDRQSFVQSRLISWRWQGKRKLSVRANTTKGSVWQDARFAGDVAFWKERLSAPATVIVAAGGKALRFYVYNAADFDALKEAVADILPTKTFVDRLPTEGAEPLGGDAMAEDYAAASGGPPQ